MIILLIVCSYLLGNLLSGSIISKFFYKQEIHVQGSGNPGARNLGRLYGRKAFIFTFIGDALKGALVVMAAKALGFGSAIELLALFTVLLGHVYPIFYGFRGGKGVSTFIGGFLLFNPIALMIFIGVFLIFYAFIKSFTVAGMIAILSFPIIIFMYGSNLSSIFIASFISGLIIYAHRENITKKTKGRKEPSQ